MMKCMMIALMAALTSAKEIEWNGAYYPVPTSGSHHILLRYGHAKDAAVQPFVASCGVNKHLAPELRCACVVTNHHLFRHAEKAKERYYSSIRSRVREPSLHCGEEHLISFEDDKAVSSGRTYVEEVREKDGSTSRVCRLWIDQSELVNLYKAVTKEEAENGSVCKTLAISKKE